MTPELPAPLAAPYKNRRGWLIAFGVVEILIGCFCLLTLGFVIFSFLMMGNRIPPVESSMSPAALLTFIEVLYGGMAAFFFVVGVGSIRCRNWARVTMIVVSSLWLGTGVLSMFFLLVVFPTMMRQHGPIPPGAARIVLALTMATMAIFMMLMPAVFLIFYTRKNVKATCLSQGAGEAQASPAVVLAASQVPVPVLILAIWEALGTSAFVSLLFIRATVIFGVVIYGLGAIFLMIGYSVLNGIVAWLIYRQRFMGWAIAIGKNFFWIASTLVTLAVHDLLEIYRQMGMKESQLRFFQQVPQMLTAGILMGLLFLVAQLIFLLYTRKFFLRVGRGTVTAN